LFEATISYDWIRGRSKIRVRTLDQHLGKGSISHGKQKYTRAPKV
jgi:hypothetical protein